MTVIQISKARDPTHLFRRYPQSLSKSPSLISPMSRPLGYERMRQVWRKILTVFGEMQPEVTQDFYPPSPDQLAQLELWLGQSLPEDLRQLYKMHNGQGVLGKNAVVQIFNGGIFEGYTFLPLPRVAEELHHLQAYPNWIPFAFDERESYLCIDLTKSVAGQILEINRFGEAQVLAENFTDYLETLLSQITRYYRMKTAATPQSKRAG